MHLTLGCQQSLDSYLYYFVENVSEAIPTVFCAGTRFLHRNKTFVVFCKFYEHDLIILLFSIACIADSVMKRRKVAKVAYSYSPENQDELSLEVGEVVEVLNEVSRSLVEYFFIYLV
jgi:hypothetical protein